MLILVRNKNVKSIGNQTKSLSQDANLEVLVPDLPNTSHGKLLFDHCFDVCFLCKFTLIIEILILARSTIEIICNNVFQFVFGANTKALAVQKE